VARTVVASVEALECRDAAAAQRLIEADDQIDEKRYHIERDTLLLIATQQPLAGDLRLVASILTIATELERIGDYCEGICRLTLRLAAEEVELQLSEMRQMAEVTERQLRDVLTAYKNRDLEAAGQVWARDDKVDELYEQTFRKLLAGMTNDPSAVRRNTYLLWVAHNLERIADRVTNIAERIAFVVTGDIQAFRESILSRTVPG
jgi:phosphate transport system protein